MKTKNMSYDIQNAYRLIPFSKQTPFNEIFLFKNVPDLLLEIKMKRDTVMKCRTIGALQSVNGHFYLNDIQNAAGDNSELPISMIYYNGAIPPCVLPNTVQIFGTLQWQERPILFVKILQVLTPPMAIRLKKALTSISDRHLALTHTSELVNQN